MTKLMQLIKKKTEKQLIIEFISSFKILTKRKEKNNKRFSFVLTGGKSPINLYKTLAKTKINWNNIDLFWSDERLVDLSSKNSNFNLVNKYLIKKIKIDKKNIYQINTKNNTAVSSALNYENKIKHYFNSKIIFDLVLLGMGADGHIASIFPSNKNLNTSNICSAIYKKDFKRITLNLKVINNSKKIILWLSSKQKSMIYQKLKVNKKIPVSQLKRKNLTIFTL